ncbi:MAG TPA: type IV secretion system DNA-binding domain-containing protein, partial [Bryobacteraceae bacterium]|nr:type IV secretion system DNA-binding domain-containing protein [Bryobacteraceae bacterium]
MACESFSAGEALTRQFYDWEMRGRGWQVSSRPVALEPPFRPFFGHFVPGTLATIVDDGRKPTFLSNLIGGLFKGSDSAGSTLALPDECEPEPIYMDAPARIVEVQAVLPPDTKITKDAAGQFLMSLGDVSHPASFEVLGKSDSILVQLASVPDDRRQVREQLQAYFPEVLLTERRGYLEALWDRTGAKGSAVVEYGLSKEFMRPLRSFERFDPDPLAGLIGAMAELGPEDTALFQVLFAPVRHAWPESIIRAVTDAAGDSFFIDDPAMVKLAAEKISSPLFAAVIRVAAQSPKSARAWRIAESMGKSLRQFADTASNELLPLANDEYEDDQHCEDVVTRRSCRSGLIINRDELVSIVHLPSASARSAKLKREERKTKAAPSIAFGHTLRLGENHHAGKTVPVSLGAEQRVRHMHLIGASGSGKSTLLLNMIVQDIENGDGLAILDPHGDLIDEVIGRIPEERINDIVLLDPSDEAYPVGFNILSAHSDLERNLLASDLVSVFRRLSTSFGDQMTTVLGNAILAFLESTEGGTLADLRKFLIEPGFRQRFLESVQDPEIIYYWQKEFPLLTGKPQGPILTRLDTFLRPKVIRHMVSQKENRLDFAAIMNGRKILLAKLSQGLIGEENSYLLGTLIVSKLNQIATSRQNLAASERKPFYLYIDEFHNFVAPSLAAILSGARKYNLGLILAHQELHQLSNRDSDVASAVISNPYTRVCFRLGDFDAKKLEEGFSFFKAKDLQNLSVGEAIVRMERAEYDFNLKTVPLPPVDPALAAGRRERIVASSRERYAARREEVGAINRARHSPGESEPEALGRKTRIRMEVPLPEGKTVSEPPRDAPSFAPQMPGRGGEQHKYLQQLIKRWAEGRGYQVTIEKPVLDGLGIVDVVLEKRGCAPIACEISVTTSPEHELANAEKCLAAGFEHIFLVAPDKNVLSRVRTRAASVLNPNQMKKVQFVLPEQVFASVSVLEARVAPLNGTTEESKELLTAKEVEELVRI